MNNVRERGSARDQCMLVVHIVFVSTKQSISCYIPSSCQIMSLCFEHMPYHRGFSDVIAAMAMSHASGKGIDHANIKLIHSNQESK